MHLVTENCSLSKRFFVVTGKKVKYSETSHEQYLKGPWPNETIAREIYEGYMVMSEFGCQFFFALVLTSCSFTVL